MSKEGVESVFNWSGPCHNSLDAVEIFGYSIHDRFVAEDMLNASKTEDGMFWDVRVNSIFSMKGSEESFIDARGYVDKRLKDIWDDGCTVEENKYNLLINILYDDYFREGVVRDLQCVLDAVGVPY